MPLARLSALLLLAAATASAGKTEGPPPELTRRFEGDVRALAADDMEGRGLGTAGLGRAADYLETRLRALGLRPAFASRYRQPARIKTGVTLADGNALEGLATGDWTPLGASSSGPFAGEVVFAGYGIEVPYEELGSDYFDRRHTERVRRRAVQTLERRGYRVILEPAA